MEHHSTRGRAAFGSVPTPGVSMYVEGVFRHIASPQGFESIRVRSLLEDRKGALWVGTDGAGVYARDGSHVTIYNRHNGLSGKFG